ncbi:MAG: hypothetical protein OXP75_16760 [Rhodospirillales bacterium]|nr:hypothetical protein [Rhodospirillales bacterium]
MSAARNALVETAKRYPFPRPGYSFLYVDGEALRLNALGDALEEAEVEIDGQTVPAGTLLRQQGLAAPAPLSRRTPVLAYGANAAPERLQRKFAPVGPAVFPVLQAKLHGFDVVHAAHISSYGAVPATLAPSPGTVCDIAITCLDDRELARMHETEFRRHTYRFGPLRNIRLEPDLLPPMETVSTYVGGFGHIGPEGAPLALAAIRAEGRRFRTCSQTEALRAIQAMLGVPGPLDEFILEAVDDEAVRRERTARLRAQAQPFSYQNFSPTAE